MTKISPLSPCLCGNKNICGETSFGHAILWCVKCERSTGTIRKRRSWDEAKDDWNRMNKKEIKSETTSIDAR